MKVLPALKIVEDRRLIRLTKFCQSLPESSRQYNGQHAQFLVRNRTFAHYLDDHHGDGVVCITCKRPFGENEVLIASDPVRFFMPAYLGPKGWVALRLDVSPIDWKLIAELVTDSYGIVAPKLLTRRARHEASV